MKIPGGHNDGQFNPLKSSALPMSSGLIITSDRKNRLNGIEIYRLKACNFSKLNARLTSWLPETIYNWFLECTNASRQQYQRRQNTRFFQFRRYKWTIMGLFELKFQDSEERFSPYQCTVPLYYGKLSARRRKFGVGLLLTATSWRTLITCRWVSDWILSNSTVLFLVRKAKKKSYTFQQSARLKRTEEENNWPSKYQYMRNINSYSAVQENLVFSFQFF